VVFCLILRAGNLPGLGDYNSSDEEQESNAGKGKTKLEKKHKNIHKSRLDAAIKKHTLTDYDLNIFLREK